MFFTTVQGQSSGKWSLRDCVNYAIENNIEIKQQSLNVENAEIELSTSKNSRLPNLNASIGHNFNFGNAYSDVAKDYISANNSGTSFDINTQIPLFTGFKITNDIAARKFDLLSATEGLKKAKDNIGLQVASYYLDALFKKEILKVYNEQADLTSKQVDRTSILVETGKVPLSQLYDIKAQLAKDELNITNAKNDHDLSLLNLAQLLNLKDNGFDIDEPAINDINENLIMSVEQVYDQALLIKPHVKEAEYNIESSKKSLKVAESGYYPTLSMGMSYSTRSQRIYGIDNDSFRNQMKNNSGEYIGFTLSIPIFNRFQVRNQVRSARLNIQNNELMLDNIKLSLYKEIQQAYQNAVAAQARYTSTEKAFLAAEESFKYAQEKYNVGKLSVYEYADTQTKLISSKSEQIQAKYDFAFRIKILDFYAGKEIDLE